MKIYNLKLKLILSIILIGLVTLSCKDDGEQDKKDPKNKPTLEGSVWMHHPDTENIPYVEDPANNPIPWFNLLHNPNPKYSDPNYINPKHSLGFPPGGVQLTFTKDLILNNYDVRLAAVYGVHDRQKYGYSFDGTNIRVFLYNDGEYNNIEFKPCKHFDFKNQITYVNDCRCNSPDSGYSPNPDYDPNINTELGYLGEIDGDSMTLHNNALYDGKISTTRFIRLVRVK